MMQASDGMVLFALPLAISCGTFLGLCLTLWIFFLAILRTPASIIKLMHLTYTTNDNVFTPRYLDPILRTVVFVLAPLPRILYVCGLTLYTLIFGTMICIGQLTQIFITCQWKPIIEWGDDVVCNVDWDDLTITQVKDIFVENKEDDWYFGIMYGLKLLCSLVPGFILGVLPFIPFSIIVLLITLYRLPVNVYKSTKVVMNTVALNWDLKTLTLLMLPIIHTTFVIVVFATALIGSFIHFVFVTIKSIVNSESPFHEWGRFRTELERYHDAHKQFVGDNYLGRYDHPTGIPLGWDGEQYGIPIQRILKWQWDFLVCCILMLISVPICFAGSVIIFTLKFIPTVLQLWKNLCTENEQIFLWPCILLAVLLTPAIVFALSTLEIVSCTLMSFRVPTVYLADGYKAGCYEPLTILVDVDSWSCFGIPSKKLRVLFWLPDNNNNNNRLVQHEVALNRRNDINRQTTPADGQSLIDTNAYWDRFTSQCVNTTSELIVRKWISLDDVEAMEPALVSTIPATSILTILSDSVNNFIEGTMDHGDILWKIDGTVCKEADRQRLDNIERMLWPKVMPIKRLLRKKMADDNQKMLADAHNVQIIQAMICSNAECLSSELNAFLENNQSQPNSSDNRDIRAKLIELTLMLIRVKPYQDRMSMIFDHKYD